MKITKTTSKTYEIKFYFHPNVWNIPMSEFISARRARGQVTSYFEKCFCCGYSFSEEEIPIIVSVKGVGNRFACKECLDKEIAGGGE